MEFNSGFKVLNKISIHNTSSVLTCESLLLTCIRRTQWGWIT